MIFRFPRRAARALPRCPMDFFTVPALLLLQGCRGCARSRRHSAGRLTPAREDDPVVGRSLAQESPLRQASPQCFPRQRKPSSFRCTGEDCIKRRLSFRTLSPETNSSYGRRGSRLFTKSFLTKRLLCVPPVTPCRGFDRRAGHSRPWISLPWPAALSGQVFPTIAGQSALGSRLPVASGTGDVAAGAGSLPATGLRGAVQTKGDDGGPAARSGGVGPAEFCGPHPPALVSNGTPRGVPDAGSRERSGGAAPPRSRAPPRPRPR